MMKIHEFDPQIYPCKLWVSVRPTFEEVSGAFYALNDNNERMEVSDSQWKMDHFVVARTHAVSSRTDGWIGVYVGVNKPKMMTAKFIAHESCHCADFICESFGITSRKFDDGEAYAYLVGWIAGCIEKTIKFK